jgi:hypothetical protein
LEGFVENMLKSEPRSAQASNIPQPREIIFYVNEGTLLRFVVSKDEIMINPKRTKVVSKIPFHTKISPCNPFLEKSTS